MEQEEVTGPPAQEDPGGGQEENPDGGRGEEREDGQDRDDYLITPRAGLIIGVSAIAGIWVGCVVGTEAGSATALAVATLLDRLFQRDR